LIQWVMMKTWVSLIWMNSKRRTERARTRLLSSMINLTMTSCLFSRTPIQRNIDLTTAKVWQ
jgi:hypothetical protein